MRISISATNPCHLYHLALELAGLDAMGTYYSGYPGWRLPGSERLDCRTHSLRTLVVYGLLRCPGWLQPPRRSLFLWQDIAFDRWVGRALEPADFLHAMPGQCLRSFRRARELGVRTVLNHATGPVRQWLEMLRPEYERVGLDVAQVTPFDGAYLEREREEYALADFHCAASGVVRDQLVAEGVDPGRIVVAPYGADRSIFHQRGAVRDAAGPFRIVFAGQVGVRKGVRFLLDALEAEAAAGWEVDFFGAVLPEARAGLDGYRGRAKLRFHGPVPQARLAEAFRSASVLVLPSVEEGFGLVVVQALNCGLPCVVSDRVGAKDLIRHRENGSVLAFGSADALLNELQWWRSNPRILNDTHAWNSPAKILTGWSASRLADAVRP